MKFNKNQALKALNTLGYNINDYNFSLNQLRKGMDIEGEHLYNKDKRLNLKGKKYIIACKIALAHLFENHKYYKLLSKYIEK